MNFLTGVAAVLIVIAHSAAAVGGNDDFSRRSNLPPAESFVLEVHPPATLSYEPLDPMSRSDFSPYSSQRQGSLWWEWTAPRDGWFTVSLTRPEWAAMETYVFQGNSLERLVPVQNGNYLGLTLLNTTLFEAKQGQRYQIGARLIDSATPDEGGEQAALLTLRSSAGPPLNDTMERRAVLTGSLPVNIVTTNIAQATLEVPTLSRMAPVGSFYGFPSTYGPVLWWEWTAPETGRFDLRIKGIQGFTFVARRRLSQNGGAGEAGVWENTNLNVDGSTFMAEAGRVYDIAVVTPASYERSHTYGDFSLKLDRATLTGPSNMSQETSAALPDSLPFHFSYYWPGGPVPVDGSGTIHLWWKFTAPVAGIYHFTYRNWAPTLHFAPGAEESHGALQLLRAGETLWLEYVLYPSQELTVDIKAALLPAPPANDQFVNALDVGSAAEFELLGHRSLATMEPDEPALETGDPDANGTGTLWWRWTAPGKGWLRKSGGLSTDVALEVFHGGSIETLGEGRKLNPLIDVAPGQVCYIRAGFSPGEEHAICAVRLDFLPSPANTTPALATNLGITTTPVFRQSRPNPPAPLQSTLWYRWTAPQKTRCDFIFSPTADSVVIYTDPLAGDILRHDPVSETWEFLAGQTYWLKLSVSSTRDAAFEMRREPLTANGDISTALVVGPELPATATATTRGDRNSAAEVDVLGGFVWPWDSENRFPAVWWRWQAPRDQWVRCHCEAFNSGLNSFHIYSGSHPHDSVVATPAPFDSEARYFKARRDETYWFAAVGHIDTARSSQFIRLDLRPVMEIGPSNDHFAASAVITRTQWNTEQAVIGIHRGTGNRHPLHYEWTQATLEPDEPPVSLILGEEGHAVSQTASTWWQWTAPASGLYKMILRPDAGGVLTNRDPRTPDGGADDALLDLTASIYTGASLTGLQPLMQYEPLAGEYCFRAVSGTRYSIRVASGDAREYYVLQPVIASHEDIFDFWAIENLLFESVGDAYVSYASDGIPNYLKLIFGFDPWLPAGHPDNAAARANLPHHVFSPGNLEMRCRTDPALAPGGNPENYSLFGTFSTDLTTWNYLAPVSLTGGELSLRVPMIGPRAFLMWDPFTFFE